MPTTKFTVELKIPQLHFVQLDGNILIPKIVPRIRTQSLPFEPWFVPTEVKPETLFGESAAERVSEQAAPFALVNTNWLAPRDSGENSNCRGFLKIPLKRLRRGALDSPRPLLQSVPAPR